MKDVKSIVVSALVLCLISFVGTVHAEQAKMNLEIANQIIEGCVKIQS